VETRGLKKGIMKGTPMKWGDKTTKTLVIPTYSVSDRLIRLAYQCALSHRNQVNQIIITEDGGRYSKLLKDIADIYLYSKNNVGFTKNVNRGWGLSEADFTIIANSDTYLVSGNLRDLCEKPTVTCPAIENLGDYPGFCGSYFAVPREIKEKYGMLDERLIMYGSDDDYYMRIKDVFRKEGRVVIHHYKGSTIKKAKIDVRAESIRDSNKYKEIVETEYPERKTW
jgi:GT2 family glycosyltransferase